MLAATRLAKIFRLTAARRFLFLGGEGAGPGAGQARPHRPGHTQPGDSPVVPARPQVARWAW